MGKKDRWDGSQGLFTFTFRIITSVSQLEEIVPTTSLSH